MLLELVAIRYFTGDWVFRLGLVQDQGDALVERMTWQGGANPFSRFWYALDGRLLPIAPITTFLLLAGAIAYPFLLRGRGRNLGLQLFFWWPVVYLTVGSTSFTAYLPPSIQSRYYALAIVPGAVMTAAVVGELVRRWREWARVPAWTRGRAPVAALVVALIAIACFELNGNLPGAGNIYAAERARGFVATYQRAKERYPQYPIALGHYYGRRMMPLFLRWDDAKEIFAGRFGLRAVPPDPPYLFLEWAREANDAENAFAADLELTKLEVVYPPQSRMTELDIGLRRVFGLDRPEATPVKKMGAGAIYLVTKRSDRSAGGARANGSPLDGKDATITALDVGHLVSWEDGQLPVLQFHERGSIKTAPVAPTARLSTPAQRVRVTVPLRLVTGRAVTLAYAGFGYRADGAAAANQTHTQKLVAGAAPVIITIDLAADAPISTYRLRLSVKRIRGPGTLFVGEPRVESLPDATPAGAPPSGSP